MCHIIVCVCVCPGYVHAFLAPLPSKSLWLLGGSRGGGGAEGQVIAGLTSPVLRFAESYQCISAMSFADQRHFQTGPLSNLNRQSSF